MFYHFTFKLLLLLFQVFYQTDLLTWRLLAWCTWIKLSIDTDLHQK